MSDVEEYHIPDLPGSDRALGTEVYRQVWNEFYSWEPEYCQQRLQELAAASTEPMVTVKLSEMIEQDGPLSPEMNMDIDGSSCVFARANQDGSYTESRVHFKEITTGKHGSLEPHPRYESCPPTNKSYFNTRDLSKLSFIPYADEDGFSQSKYTEEFKEFLWQSKIDPDLQLIQYETARRLLYEHETRFTTFADIDRLKILQQLRGGDASGLIWEISQRDILHWPGASLTDYDHIPTSQAPDAEDLHRRLQSILPLFCPNLNCLQAKCPTHTFPYPTYDPEKPKVTNLSMTLSEGEPCGDECFRLIDDLYAETVYWDQVDTDILATILSTTADLYPCSLAILCHKPCREVFVQRNSLFPDEIIKDVVDEPIEPRRRKLRFVDATLNLKEKAEPFIPMPPCHHKGQCSSELCSCHANELHCSRNCRCDLSCKRRWKGCTCRKNAKSCRESKRCRCLKEGRECDPELCGCDAKGTSRNPCKNTEIQRGRSKLLILKSGEFGLGAYAGEDIPAGAFIGDYVGTLFHGSDDVEKMEHESNYNGLNYLFEVNVDVYIDALKMGNATRFVNHDEDKDNCSVLTKQVHSDIHLGFVASKRIRRGAEVLLHYGDKYWNNTKSKPRDEEYDDSDDTHDSDDLVSSSGSEDDKDDDKEDDLYG